MKWVWDLIKAIVSALFGVLMDHPIEEKEKTGDIGREQPDDPDKAFADTDW